MARRRKGRDVSGWVILDKPTGPSSTAMVNKLRWAFQARKAGHAGTLDPDATGLLAVALGEATKTIPFVTDGLKTYAFRVRFGSATDTDDAGGTAIAWSDARPSDAGITAALPRFVGDIMQVPPQFSAVKVEGERAYDRAREGETSVLAARPLHVARLTLAARLEPDTADLHLVCGKGGYVRSIARDLGAALGCHAHVQWLRRLSSEPFDLDGAATLERVDTLARTPEIDALLRPLEEGLAALPFATCSAEAAARLRHGNPAPVLTTTAGYGDTAWAAHQGRAIAIGTYRAGELHPRKVLLTGGKG